MQRLGKNHNGYHGETIEIRAVLDEIVAAASRHNWTSEVFHEQAGFKWVALRRKSLTTGASRPLTRIYISAGIHGDEPAGTLATLKLLQDNTWPENTDITLLPCLNPIGFTLNQRTNAQGIDLNRDYRAPKCAEVQAHISWLLHQSQFDCHFCLHEDWESDGFYLYEQNPNGFPSLAADIIDAVKNVCPIDLSPTIEGHLAESGVIRPKTHPAKRPDWPEAIFLISHKSRQGYTLEAPSDFPLAVRTNSLIAAVLKGISFTNFRSVIQK